MTKTPEQTDISEEILKCVPSDSNIADTFAGNFLLAMKTILFRLSISYTNLVVYETCTTSRHMIHHK